MTDKTETRVDQVLPAYIVKVLTNLAGNKFSLIVRREIGGAFSIFLERSINMTSARVHGSDDLRVMSAGLQTHCLFRFVETIVLVCNAYAWLEDSLRTYVELNACDGGPYDLKLPFVGEDLLLKSEPSFVVFRVNQLFKTFLSTESSCTKEEAVRQAHIALSKFNNIMGDPPFVVLARLIKILLELTVAHSPTLLVQNNAGEDVYMHTLITTISFKHDDANALVDARNIIFRHAVLYAITKEGLTAQLIFNLYVTILLPDVIHQTEIHALQNRIRTNFGTIFQKDDESEPGEIRPGFDAVLHEQKVDARVFGLVRLMNVAALEAIQIDNAQDRNGSGAYYSSNASGGRTYRNNTTWEQLVKTVSIWQRQLPFFRHKIQVGHWVIDSLSKTQTNINLPRGPRIAPSLNSIEFGYDSESPVAYENGHETDNDLYFNHVSMNTTTASAITTFGLAKPVDELSEQEVFCYLNQLYDAGNVRGFNDLAKRYDLHVVILQELEELVEFNNLEQRNTYLYNRGDGSEPVNILLASGTTPRVVAELKERNPGHTLGGNAFVMPGDAKKMAWFGRDGTNYLAAYVIVPDKDAAQKMLMNPESTRIAMNMDGITRRLVFTPVRKFETPTASAANSYQQRNNVPSFGRPGMFPRNDASGSTNAPFRTPF